MPQSLEADGATTTMILLHRPTSEPFTGYGRPGTPLGPFADDSAILRNADLMGMMAVKTTTTTAILDRRPCNSKTGNNNNTGTLPLHKVRPDETDFSRKKQPECRGFISEEETYHCLLN